METTDAKAFTGRHVGYAVLKRDGSEAAFDGERIRIAIEKAFRAELQLKAGDVQPAATTLKVNEIAANVIQWCLSQHSPLHVEGIQDEVERTLMAAGEYRVARRYVLYREQHAELRRAGKLNCLLPDGTLEVIDRNSILEMLDTACSGMQDEIDLHLLLETTLNSLYDKIPQTEILQAAIMAARSHTEIDPAYSFVAARLLLQLLFREISSSVNLPCNMNEYYQHYFPVCIQNGVKAGVLDSRMGEYNLILLAEAIHPERDLKFAYLGLQTLYDRYLLQIDDRRIELPQIFWMRVAMGIALNEPNRNEKAIEFYHLISQFLFTPATPTLFNSGTCHSQLSSCYLTTVSDNLENIFKCLQDNALLSKWAGGLGNDWTPVRALGAKIRGTSGRSQGVVPFLKVANDAALAVNQGGKRKGAVCAYLETWHLDIEEFLELRKNTGDDRRRTHDMNTANWIPDLFMERVKLGKHWTLFSPDDVPDLHELYGKEFQTRYEHYEQQVQNGKITLYKTLPAIDLWRKMLSMLFETGHPWLTWKDPSNIRSSQDHVGVVHNSNLCTEILLNNSSSETAVCNLGSINLAAHIVDKQLNHSLLSSTTMTAVRMLDNVIDLNFYPTKEARQANLRHRPVGLGIMGFQNALYATGISYASDEAVEFSDASMEAVSYYAILASTQLASERGSYETYHGSKWHRGLLPLDTVQLLDDSRSVPTGVPTTSKLDWERVRQEIAKHGMRNSNVLAIAPTATISNIIGVSQSIEPTYRNLYVKSNLSGDFTQINSELVRDLKLLGIWDEDMRNELKYYDGVLQEIDRIPDAVKQKFLTAFEIEPEWLIECAARRQKWIDMGQSLNLYLAQPSGKKLNEMYFFAWQRGLKTTYYLRTLAATQIEKSTLDINKYGVQPRWMRSRSASMDIQVMRPEKETHAQLKSSCDLDGTCEACQ